MTYAELLKRLQTLSSEQLQQNVTVRIDEEFFPAVGTGTAETKDGALDVGHLYLFID